MLLTDDEILNAINDAPLAQGPGTFVLAVGRAIERKVLEKQRGRRAQAIDNRTRPLIDQSLPWGPEHCKTYPRRAAEEIEYLRGQLAAVDAGGSGRA